MGTIKEITEDDVRPAFTCKRCGGHSCNKVPITQSQYGGVGAGQSYLVVCVGCNFSDKIEE